MGYTKNREPRPDSETRGTKSDSKQAGTGFPNKPGLDVENFRYGRGDDADKQSEVFNGHEFSVEDGADGEHSVNSLKARHEAHKAGYNAAVIASWVHNLPHEPVSKYGRAAKELKPAKSAVGQGARDVTTDSRDASPNAGETGKINGRAIEKAILSKVRADGYDD